MFPESDLSAWAAAAVTPVLTFGLVLPIALLLPSAGARIAVAHGVALVATAAFLTSRWGSANQSAAIQFAAVSQAVWLAVHVLGRLAMGQAQLRRKRRSESEQARIAGKWRTALMIAAGAYLVAAAVAAALGTIGWLTLGFPVWWLVAMPLLQLALTPFLYALARVLYRFHNVVRLTVVHAVTATLAGLMMLEGSPTMSQTPGMILIAATQLLFCLFHLSRFNDEVELTWQDVFGPEF